MEKIHVKRYNEFIPMSGFWATVIGKIFYIKEEKNNYYLIWKKRYGGSHFAYLISEPFFATLLLCFVSWGWLNPTVQASVFSSSIHPVTDTGKSWDQTEKSGYFAVSLPQAFLLLGSSFPWTAHPATGTAHTRQSPAVDLARDEQSPPLVSGNDTCL